MAHYITGPMGGLSHSRSQGTKVTLAGRTAFLPNVDVPLVVQKLTMGQIQAIPKERFVVSLIETPVAMVGPGKKGRLALSGSKLQRPRRQVFPKMGDDVIRFVQKPSSTITVDTSGTKLYTTMVALLEQAKQNAEGLYDENLLLSRNQRGTPPAKDSGLFYPPIDDGSMSDCIKKAMAHFFGQKDTCKINGKEYKPAAFCLLMHDYFIRMHILKNATRTPFCEYLQKHVLDDKTMFTSRTFTNYANEYKDVEKDFTEQGRLKINFNVHPEPTGTKLDAFHEIGNFFHTSPYFKHLRELRDNMKGFMI